MTDARGLPVSTRSAAALDAAGQALWRMMTFYDTPLADLDVAEAADPGWVLPRLMRAGFLLSLTEAGHAATATALLDTVDAAIDTGRLRPPTGREQAHRQALRALAEGRSHQACATWDTLLIDHPTDALALQWAHLWDFHRGDLAGLRGRPARCLAAFDDGDPLLPPVLALWAFGLEENHLHAAAEDAGRRALARDPKLPWAIHAVAHVMEMQGRFEEGAAWLRLHQPAWAEDNGFAAHLWWHSALFRLEGLDTGGVLRLVDGHLSGDRLQVTLQRLDAASMLWRLHLLEVDVAARAAALAADWPLDEADAGHSAFNDVHALLALLAASELGRADAWVSRCAARAMAADRAGRTVHRPAREVGLPLMRGLLAQARGDADAAAAALYPLRSTAQTLGGSHAQRDLIDQTLLAVCVRGRLRPLGEALLRERALARAASPLARHWAARLGAPVPVST